MHKYLIKYWNEINELEHITWGTASVINADFILKQQYVWLLKTIRKGGKNIILEKKKTIAP